MRTFLLRCDNCQTDALVIDGMQLTIHVLLSCHSGCRVTIPERVVLKGRLYLAGVDLWGLGVAGREGGRLAGRSAGCAPAFAIAGKGLYAPYDCVTFYVSVGITDA